MIDLHTHSTFSDGSLTPAELAAEGARVGLKALALTDHDNLQGVPAFLEACRQHGLQGIGGVEISLEAGPGTMHLLGYFVDPKHPGLCEALGRILEGREDRNQLILKRLNELGYPLTWDEVAQYAGEDVVGRPHFAQALVARGLVKDKDAAFERLLAKGKPAYVDRFRLAPAEALRLLRAAGGVPALAHPFTLNLSNAKLRELVAELRGLGLEALEAYYSEHSPDLQARYCAMARELDLAVTGGSDFHGSMNPGVKLGIGFGGLRVPDELVEPLHARIPRG
jgi:predicted metal-dependent phosphoesterase TrpH